MLNKVLHFMVLLLVLSFWLPEIRIGLSGFVYPPPGADIGSDIIIKVGLPWVFEIIIIAMAPVFLLGMLLGEVHFKFSWSAVSVLIMAGIAIMVIPLSQAMGLRESGAAFGHKRFTFESFALILIVSQMKWGDRNLRRVVWLFIGAAVFHSVVVLLSSRNINILPINTAVIESSELGRYAGLFSQPGRFALFVSMGIILIYSLMIQQRKLSLLKLLFFMGLMLICVAGLMLGETRATFGGVALTLILSTYRSPKISPQLFKKTFLIVAIFLCIALFIAVVNLIPYLIGRFGSGFLSQEHTTARGWVWPLALEAILYYPLGIGYVSLNDITGANVAHAHSLFLHWTVMFGIPALILLIYFLVKLFRGIKIVEVKKIRGIEYVTALKWAVVVFLINGITDPYFITNVGIYFWLFAGILLSYIQNYDTSCSQLINEPVPNI